MVIALDRGSAGAEFGEWELPNIRWNLLAKHLFKAKARKSLVCSFQRV